MTARIMAKLLRQNGYLVTTANNVAGALDVPLEDYDLVVSDIGLPDGTGLDLMRTIRLRHDVPGIALTGFGMEEDVRKSREAGFVAHLTKPLDFARLDVMIRKVFTRRTRRRPGRLICRSCRRSIRIDRRRTGLSPDPLHEGGGPDHCPLSARGRGSGRGASQPLDGSKFKAVPCPSPRSDRRDRWDRGRPD